MLLIKGHPSVVHLLLATHGGVDELDHGSLLEGLSLVEFSLVGVEGSLEDSADEGGKTSFELVGSQVSFHVSLFRESLDLSEGDHDHTGLGHEESLEEVSLDVGDLSVLSELVDGLSDLGVLAVVEEVFEDLQD